MKIELNGNKTLEFSGEFGARRTMGMELNGKAFRMVTNNLYQNKPGSIVRELFCNALDAMLEAGKGECPVRVHVPDVLNPWFSVTDEGIGMSKETVFDIFGIYFRSTKDRDDTKIGGYGIGGKTPLAYADKFTLTSTFNGVRTYYSIFYNEEGSPDIMILGEEETDDCNGVHVELAVEPGDVDHFREEIIDQLRFVPVAPTLLNAGDLELARMPTPAYEDEDLILLSKEDVVGTVWNQPSVRLGPVGYHIQKSIVEKYIKGVKAVDLGLEVNELEVATNILSLNGLVLKFNIGEVEVIASRENLDYSARTMNAIISLLVRVGKRLKAQIDAIMASDEPIGQKLVTLNNMGELRRLTGLRKIDLGLTPESPVFVSGITERISDNAKIHPFAGGSIRKQITYMSGTYSGDKIRVMEYNVTTKRASGLRMSLNESNKVTIDPESKLSVVFINDVKTGVTSRIKQYMHEEKRTSMFVIKGNSDYTQEYLVSDKFAEDFAESSGGLCKLRKLSEIILPERARSARGYYAGKRAPRPTGYQYNLTSKNNLSYDISEWERLYDPIDTAETFMGEDYDEVYYVEGVNGQIQGDLPLGTSTFIIAMKEGAVPFRPLIAIRPGDVKKLAGDTAVTWTRFEDAVNEFIEEMKKRVNYSTAKANANLMKTIYSASNIVEIVNSLKSHNVRLPSEDTVLMKLYNAYNTATDNLASISRIDRRIMENMGNVGLIRIKNHSRMETKLNDFVVSVMEDMPLIENTTSIKSAKAADHIVDYINTHCRVNA
jgi:hypothetical protein